MLRTRVVHPAVQADGCDTCHRPGAKPGKCKSRTASGWALTKDQPDLCYDCHERKDAAKEVHGAVRTGDCLACHAVHGGDLPALLKLPREQLCFSCHDVATLATSPVKHAPVAEGRCLDCHDPHGSSLPKALRAQGKSLCLRCHEQSAPAGKGTPGPAFRLDLKRPVMHYPVSEGDCGDCHVVAHGGENPRLLKKSPPALCHDCHDRQDRQKYVHGAVLAGDCTVCHDPHGSSSPKLLARESQKELCFQCHQDDVTGRAVLHPPVADGKCLECHGAHGAPNRANLLGGSGKQACYACHQPVDQGKVKHAALERYGCTGCHDPHGAANTAMLAKPVNALCVSCHPDDPDGRHAAAMVPGGHLVSGRLDPRRPGRQFSCASCHNPHGSDNPRLFYYGSEPMESCAGCHGDKSGRGPGPKPVTNLSRPGAPAAAESGASRAPGGGGAPAR
jgi:predicted CXXCH cytochrome family protein